MEMSYWLIVNWPWVIAAIIIIGIIISLKNKVVRKKLHSMFGWPPEP